MQNATILVVDDTPDNLQMISGILRDRWQVKVATGGEKALRIAAGNPPPDLILLDIQMPEMDGFEVLRRLKAEPATAGIPVLFLSASDAAGDREAGRALGAVGHLAKPVDPEALRDRVLAILPG